MRTVGLHTGWLNFFDFLFLHKVEMKPSIPANVWFTKDSCHMGNFGCGDGGWTLAMKIDGTQVNSLPPLRNSRYHWIEHRQIKDVILVFQRTFHYDSHFWSNRNGYNFAGGKTGFDSQETKLPTYWSTPFSKICLGMKTGHQLRFIVINRHANSLFSLIADGKYRATSLGRNTWKWLIGSRASLQPNCKRKDSMQWEATLDKHRLLTTDSYYNNSNCQSNTTREINCFSKMALKWLNRLSSLLQHLFNLTAIKTEMMMMMIWKVLIQRSSFFII